MILRLKYFFFLLFIYSLTANCQQINKEQSLHLGADLLIEEHLNILQNKKVGLVVNHTSRLSNGTHILDTLISLGINVTAIFTPEHGFYGNMERGKYISNAKVVDIPVYSLHGKVKKPTIEMLKNVEILAYDLQDLGVRFYTYISTLFYVQEAAVENDMEILVLDRANPNAGDKISGPVLNPNFKSFLGLTNLPVIYGMTSGELAQLYLNEFISNRNSKSELTTIEMKNWSRNMTWEETGIEWTPPSPNIPDIQTAIIYPGTCFLEGTNVSEGRGTEKPFLQIGAPFVSSRDLLNELKMFDDGTYQLKPLSFIPKSIEGKAENPKHFNQNCNGILIEITDEKKFDAVKFGVNLIYTLHRLYPDQFKFNNEHFDLLTGTDQIRKLILEKQTPDFIVNSWQEDINKFKSIREKYLLY